MRKRRQNKAHKSGDADGGGCGERERRMRLLETIINDASCYCCFFLASLSRSMVTMLLMMMPLDETAASCNYRESGKFLLLLSLRWSGAFAATTEEKEKKAAHG